MNPRCKQISIGSLLKLGIFQIRIDNGPEILIENEPKDVMVMIARCEHWGRAYDGSMAWLPLSGMVYRSKKVPKGSGDRHIAGYSW